MDFVTQNNPFWTIICLRLKMYGIRIKLLRIETGLTQSQLAEKLSITASTVGKYEREELQPNIDVIIELSKIFEVSTDFLLGLED